MADSAAAQAADGVLALDCGTQSLKVSVYAGGTLEVVKEVVVEFEVELAQYGTVGGQVVVDAEHGVNRSPSRMWFDALDIALVRIGRDVLAQVGVVGGAAQQHSSVWWRRFPDLVNDDASGGLGDQVEACLACSMSPTWADTSSARECRAAEARMGGASEMARRTGSVAFERFTGNQISRMARLEPAVYEATGLVHVLSAALCSVFLGRPAPTDWADAAGTNMMDLDTRDWLGELDEIFAAPGLRSKVGALTRSASVVGTVGAFAQARYGLRGDCKVVAFTGDNPASLLGAADGPQAVVVSLGTSDTVLSQHRTRDGIDASAGGLSIFPHPLGEGFMVMSCWKAGGRVRSDVKGPLSWDDVDAALLGAEPEGGDVLCFFYPEGEIAPRPIAPCKRAFRVRDGEEVDPASLSMQQLVRGVLWSRALGVAAHLCHIGAEAGGAVLTGGGSKSEAVQAVFQSALGRVVRRHRESGSASRGAAIMALRATGRAEPARQAPQSTSKVAPFEAVAHDLFRTLEAKLATEA